MQPRSASSTGSILCSCLIQGLQAAQALPCPRQNHWTSLVLLHRTAILFCTYLYCDTGPRKTIILIYQNLPIILLSMVVETPETCSHIRDHNQRSHHSSSMLQASFIVCQKRRDLMSKLQDRMVGLYHSLERIRRLLFLQRE